MEVAARLWNSTCLNPTVIFLGATVGGIRDPICAPNMSSPPTHDEAGLTTLLSSSLLPSVLPNGVTP